MKAKHTLAGALALAMLASTAVSFQVSAADTAVTLKGAKVEAEAGGEFSVDVSLEDIPSTKVNVMDFAVTYDQTILNVDSVKIGSPLMLMFPATVPPAMLRYLPPTSRTARSLSAGRPHWTPIPGFLRTV